MFGANWLSIWSVWVGVSQPGGAEGHFRSPASKSRAKPSQRHRVRVVGSGQRAAGSASPLDSI